MDNLKLQVLLANIPLVVNLDGTLVKSDTLYESIVYLLKINPFYLFSLIFWLIQGKAYFKQEIAKRTEIQPELLFLFLSLAFMKRASELYHLRDNNKLSSAGRGYLSSDFEQVASFGSASGYIAILVFALYINSNSIFQLYRQPKYYG